MMTLRRGSTCRARSSVRGGEKAEVWNWWQRGELLIDIGRALDRIPGAVDHVVVAHGGERGSVLELRKSACYLLA